MTINIGKKFLVMISSRILRCLFIWGIVLTNYVYLCNSPCIKAVYAAFGWDLANSDSFSISLHQFFTSSLAYFSQKVSLPSEAPR